MDRRLKSSKEVQLDRKNFKLRVVLLALAVAIAFISLGIGFSQLVGREAGWQVVDCGSTQINCSEDFTLNYYFGAAGISASAEYRQVSVLYSQACEEGYQYFYPEGELGMLSAQPNTAVAVSAPLYRALEQVVNTGDRCIYLAPVYVEYDRIFLCDSEAEAALYDPAQNPEVAAHIRELIRFCNDPQVIRLELLGENQVQLCVRDDYLSYARENEINSFLDFGWMKNAFIADHIAQTLLDAGYSRGFVASYDGFTRNLDADGQKYSMNVFNRSGDLVDMPAVMEYNGPMSLVYLRNYPMSDADVWHYFPFSNGRIVTAFLDPTDGMSKSSVNNLLAYSGEASCAQILLAVRGLYLADTLENTEVTEMAEEGIFTLWGQERTLYYTDPAIVLNRVSESVPYVFAYAGK